MTFLIFWSIRLSSLIRRSRDFVYVRNDSVLPVAIFYYVQEGIQRRRDGFMSTQSGLSLSYSPCLSLSQPRWPTVTPQQARFVLISGPPQDSLSPRSRLCSNAVYSARPSLTSVIKMDHLPFTEFSLFVPLSFILSHTLSLSHILYCLLILFVFLY